MEIFLSSPSVDWPHSENEKENGEDDNRHIEDKDSKEKDEKWRSLKQLLSHPMEIFLIHKNLMIIRS